ncbi:MAG: prepilin peptidase [Terracidiphilus sp.]
MIRIPGTIFFGLLGLAFGSFLNVCLSRWPAGESVIAPRSHCRACGRGLAWWENLPLLSWLALGGRCHSCRAWIGWRYPLVELAIGSLWAFESWRSLGAMTLPGAPAPDVLLAGAAGKMIFDWLLVALAALDAEHFWLPDALTLPGTALGFLLAAGLSPFGISGGAREGSWELAAGQDLLAILLCAGLILLIRWTYWLLRHAEGIGLGDAKLMAMLGAWLGLRGALLAFSLGSLLGAVAAAALLLAPAARTPSQDWRSARLPLGTFLSIGGLVSSLWGPSMLAAYLHWAGL